MKHNYYKRPFFPSTVIEWNKLDLSIHNSESLTSFKGKVLKFIGPSKISNFLCNNPKGIESLTRLGLGLSHFQEHKFKYNFQVMMISSWTPLTSSLCGHLPYVKTHFMHRNQKITRKLSAGHYKLLCFDNV